MRRGRKARGLAAARDRPAAEGAMSSLPSSGRRVRLIAVTALACVAAVFAAPVARAADGDTGRVHFMQVARLGRSTSSRATRSPDQRQWMRDHYARMKAWSPYFDSRLDWYPNAWAYRDAYAIYRTSDRASAHPEWILKDAGGNKLYIPFGCSGGTCPQYAGDIGNPAFRAAWIADARGDDGRGLQGPLRRRREHGAGGSATAPAQPSHAIDPRTGRAMTDGDLAALHGRLHGGDPRGLPGQGDRPQRDLVRRRRRPRRAPPAARRRRRRPRARLQRRRAHQRRRPLVVARRSPAYRPRATPTATACCSTPTPTRTPTACTASPPTCWSPTAATCSATARRRARRLVGGLRRRARRRRRQALPLRRRLAPRLRARQRLRQRAGRAEADDRPRRELQRPRRRQAATVSLGPAAGAVLLRDGLDPTPAAGSPPAAASAPAPAPTAAPGPGLAPVPTAAGMRPVSGVPHGAQRGRVTVRVRVPRRSGVLRVSGVVRGARSGRVLLSARSASSGRHGARRVARVGRSGRFASRLRVGAGRWHVRADVPRAVVRAR